MLKSWPLTRDVIEGRVNYDSSMNYLLKDVQSEGTIEDLGSKVRLEEVSQEGMP